MLCLTLSTSVYFHTESACESFQTLVAAVRRRVLVDAMNVRRYDSGLNVRGRRPTTRNAKRNNRCGLRPAEHRKCADTWKTTTRETRSGTEEGSV
ncbi:hypothetical protein KGM_204029 [Danaus plexippus plexippus]|uniref:Uncharacterized protein n=1 Tax=Danaus plexippus plexippus TaxID=278856 RepID=A0A212EV23_DANPL|nr:hypothetical protein KGM_204029 [Danaus plexippus plexippus]